MATYSKTSNREESPGALRVKAPNTHPSLTYNSLTIPMNRYRTCALVLLSLPMFGCGSNESQRGTVRGRVTLGGQAVAAATMSFVNKGVGVSQTATTDDDGKYEFVSYRDSGLPAAMYKVTVTRGRFMKPGEEIPQIDVAKKVAQPAPAAPKETTTIPNKYAKLESSGLPADVQPGSNPPFDYDLKADK